MAGPEETGTGTVVQTVQLERKGVTTRVWVGRTELDGTVTQDEKTESQSRAEGKGSVKEAHTTRSVQHHKRSTSDHSII